MAKTFLTINDRSQVQINKISAEIFKKNRKKVRKVAFFIKSEVIAAMSVTNYSLSQLKQKNHPYAKKRFPSKINLAAIAPLKSYNIHMRDSRLINGVKFRTKERKQKSGNSFYAEIYHTMKPYYATYVFEGTKVMIGRNPFKAIYRSEKVQKKIKEILEV